MRELKPYEIAAVKRQYQNSLPALKKIQSITEKIEELQTDRDIQIKLLEGGEAGIKNLTGGYMSTDLIKCTYELQWNEDGSPKVDKNGRQLKKRVLTFVPPVEEAPNENTEVGTIVPPTTEGMPGSDFDADPIRSGYAQTIESDTTATTENPFEGIE